MYKQYFVEFQIDIDTTKRRKTASKKLRKALQGNTAGDGEKRIYIQFPRPADHAEHTTGEVSMNFH